MHCPACRNSMDSVKVDAIELDQCKECLGVWLDYMEIDDLFALPKIPECLINMERYREPPELISEGERVCPRCREELKTIEVDGIVLDACSECKGFFADLGEIKELALAAEARFEADLTPSEPTAKTE